MANATNSTTSGNETDPVGIAVDGLKKAGSNIDWSLWLIGRITGSIVILLIILIPILIYCRYKVQINILTQPARKKVGALCRYRNICTCVLYIFCCRCCACGQRMSQALGYQKCVKPAQMLRVTFLGASNIKKQLHFFMELWAEPQENAMQMTHTYQAIGSCDFARTVRSLDWHGDEDEVVIQVVCFDSNRNVGELRIPRKAVEALAEETESYPDDTAKGARTFSVMKISKPRSRMPEADELLVPLAQLQIVPDAQEYDMLKKENQKLKTQLYYASAGQEAPMETTAPPKPEILLSLTARFMIDERKPNEGGKFDESLYEEFSPPDTQGNSTSRSS